MNNSLKNVKIIKDETFLKECLNSIPSLFEREHQSDNVKCKIFNLDLNDLEKALPSFLTNQGLRNIALQYSDRPWYLILVL